MHPAYNPSSDVLKRCRRIIGLDDAPRVNPVSAESTPALTGVSSLLGMLTRSEYGGRPSVDPIGLAATVYSIMILIGGVEDSSLRSTYGPVTVPSMSLCVLVIVASSLACSVETSCLPLSGRVHGTFSLALLVLGELTFFGGVVWCLWSGCLVCGEGEAVALVSAGADGAYVPSSCWSHGAGLQLASLLILLAVTTTVNIVHRHGILFPTHPGPGVLCSSSTSSLSPCAIRAGSRPGSVLPIYLLCSPGPVPVCTVKNLVQAVSAAQSSVSQGVCVSRVYLGVPLYRSACSLPSAVSIPGLSNDGASMVLLPWVMVSVLLLVTSRGGSHRQTAVFIGSGFLAALVAVFLGLPVLAGALAFVAVGGGISTLGTSDNSMPGSSSAGPRTVPLLALLIVVVFFLYQVNAQVPSSSCVSMVYTSGTPDLGVDVSLLGSSFLPTECTLQSSVPTLASSVGTLLVPASCAVTGSLLSESLLGSGDDAHTPLRNGTASSSASPVSGSQ
jgi:hypothetical protein